IICLYRAWISSLYSNRRLAAGISGVVEITRGVGILGAIGGHNDVVEAEGERHVASDGILLVIAGLRPVAVRTQVLIKVAAVVVNKIIAAFDHLFSDEIGGALGLGAILLAGIETVHAFAVHGVYVRDLLLE